jgi:hypothetical protein
MIMTIFLKMDKVVKGVENFYLPCGTNKSISNFRETIPLSDTVLLNISFFYSNPDKRRTAKWPIPKRSCPCPHLLLLLLFVCESVYYIVNKKKRDYWSKCPSTSG